MSIGQENRTNRWVGGKRRWCCVRRAQRKCSRCDELVCAVGKEAGDATKRARSKIIKQSDARAECSIPVTYPAQVICNSKSRRHISVSCLIKRSAARR